MDQPNTVVETRYCVGCKRTLEKTPNFILKNLICNDCVIARVQAVWDEAGGKPDEPIYPEYNPLVPKAAYDHPVKLRDYVRYRQNQKQAQAERIRYRAKINRRKWMSVARNRVHQKRLAQNWYDKVTSNPESLLPLLRERQERARKAAEAAGRPFIARLDLDSPEGVAKALARAKAQAARRRNRRDKKEGVS